MTNEQIITSIVKIIVDRNIDRYTLMRDEDGLSTEELGEFSTYGVDEETIMMILGDEFFSQISEKVKEIQSTMIV